MLNSGSRLEFDKNRFVPEIPESLFEGKKEQFMVFMNFLLFRDREERNLNDLLNLKNLHSVLKA